MVGQHEQIGKLRKETKRPGKLLSEKRLYTDHMKKVWKCDMITIYFTKMIHKHTELNPDKAPNSQIQVSDISNKTIIIYFTKAVHKDATQDQAKALNMQTQGDQ